MKEVDDTPLPESESELTVIELIQWQDAIISVMKKKIKALEKRVANLESRRMLQNDPNDDEEWY